jgi:hypothetical protein
MTTRINGYFMSVIINETSYQEQRCRQKHENKAPCWQGDFVRPVQVWALDPQPNECGKLEELSKAIDGWDDGEGGAIIYNGEGTKERG